MLQETRPPGWFVSEAADARLAVCFFQSVFAPDEAQKHEEEERRGAMDVQNGERTAQNYLEGAGR